MNEKTKDVLELTVANGGAGVRITGGTLSEIGDAIISKLKK